MATQGNGDKEQTCLAANFGETPEFCTLCAENECNSASKYAVSFLVVLSSLVIVLAIRWM